MATTNGTIKRLVSDKGFGFVESGATEYFFHQSACNRCAVRRPSGGSGSDVRSRRRSERPARGER